MGKGSTFKEDLKGSRETIVASWSIVGSWFFRFHRWTINFLGEKGKFNYDETGNCACLKKKKRVTNIKSKLHKTFYKMKINQNLFSSQISCIERERERGNSY